MTNQDPKIEVIPADDPHAGDLREGVQRVITQGAFKVAMWWPTGATGGPHRMTIEPSEHANPGELARGITTGTLRNIPLTEQTEAVRELLRAVETATVDRETGHAVERLSAIVRAVPNPGRAGRPDEFHVWVSVAYSHFARWEDKPVRQLAEAADVSEQTVKTWVKAARAAGFLTPASEGRPGGRLTAKAVELRDSLAG